MNSTLKSFRDGGVTGGTTALVTGLLIRYLGLDAVTAAALGMVAGALAARLYRLARDRWAFLREIDPGANTPPPAPATQ